MNELDLFAAIIAIPDPAERAALLERECTGRPDVRRRIEQLLDAHFHSHPFLDQPNLEQTRAFSDLEQARAYVHNEQPGMVIAGRYKLLEQIGEGGMGTVWAAEQTQPVRRKVALKLIKAGMDSKSVIARFEAERQALAVMDHPNVAKILDGGLTETGRPFFAMEYVKGVPITEYCDDARLSVTERLQLFAQVCQAVQHAHQKGIIHRDLKPSNILVAPYDDRPVPKIIDFGLAKAMHQPLTDKTLHTAHESVLGTPLYMSPEQAQWNNLDVDTRSDIYSLGVLLYELLTGTTPLEKQRFKQAAWDEIRRIIREEEPHSRFTLLFEALAIQVLQACGGISAACQLLGLNWKTMQTIVDRAVERGLLARDLSGTTQLGMDEKAQGAGHDYVTVLTDISNHRVLEVTPGRDETAANTAWKCVQAVAQQITGVALDMWPAYTKAAATHAPQAEVVHDRFHLSKHLNEAVNAVRQQEHRALQKEGDERLAGSRQLWLFNQENLSEHDAEYFNLLKELNLKTSRAWGIKELFRAFWECAGEEQATGFFKSWYSWAVRCRLDPIIKVAKRFKKHWPRIVSYFRQRITNAMSEGFNSKIQQLKHTARGFKNFPNFRNRILFFCGKLQLLPKGVTH